MTTATSTSVVDHDSDTASPAHLVGRLVVSGLALAAVLCAIGWVIVRLLTPSALTRWEDSVNQSWFLARTTFLNDASHIGSSLSETTSCIAVLIVVMLGFRWWLGRWRESLAVFAAIVGELVVFLIVTAVVNRERPGVPRLDAAPPTSSFPSGHTAAAVALYGCIAVVIARNLRPRWFAAVVAGVCVVIPIVVGLSRIYRGMHHPTDVLFGALGGGAWLLIVVRTLLPRDRPALDPPEDQDGDDVSPSRQVASP